MPVSWETQLSGLLNDLIGVQDDWFALADHKRRALAAGDFTRLNATRQGEQLLLARLEACAGRDAAPSHGHGDVAPAGMDEGQNSISATPCGGRAFQTLALCRQSLINWAAAQRSFIRLSLRLGALAMMQGPRASEPSCLRASDAENSKCLTTAREAKTVELNGGRAKASTGI